MSKIFAGMARLFDFGNTQGTYKAELEHSASYPNGRFDPFAGLRRDWTAIAGDIQTAVSKEARNHGPSPRE